MRTLPVPVALVALLPWTCAGQGSPPQDAPHADTGKVNIKATTTEELGFVGRREGIAAHAVVLLVT